MLLLPVVVARGKDSLIGERLRREMFHKGLLKTGLQHGFVLKENSDMRQRKGPLSLLRSLSLSSISLSLLLWFLSNILLPFFYGASHAGLKVIATSTYCLARVTNPICLRIVVFLFIFLD